VSGPLIRKIAAVVAVRTLACLALLSFGMTGCQTPSSRFTALETVAVPEEIAIAPPAPLAVAPAPPSPSIVSVAPTSSPPVFISKPTWPSNWVNGWIPLEGWGRFNGLTKPTQVPSNVAPIYEFHTTNGLVSLQLNSRVAHCNGLECWLGYAPQLIHGMPCVHWLDAQKNLQPLLDPPGYHFNSARTVVLDPGHGGKDSGTRSVLNAEFEKEYTLDWAMRLRRLLVTNGWNVLLTRSNDLDISLPDRVALAERAHADLFLSLHFNSGVSNRGLAGVETYCLTPAGLPSSLTRDYEDNPQHVFPNNAYDEQNFQLANRLHRSVVQSLCAADRGVRRARFMGVLRAQNRPAVLIEAGYLSNASEARKIGSAEYRQKLAEAVAKALE